MELADLTLRTDLRLDHAAALDEVKAAFAAEGFGTLTEVDVAATLEGKIGAEIPPYTILGVCNPALAHLAVTTAPAVGVLLPCGVVVRSEGEGTVVEAADPRGLVGMTGREDLAPIGEEAGRGVAAAIRRLADAHGRSDG